MSANDLAAVIVVIAGMGALCALLVGVWSLARTLTRLERTLTELRDDTVPAVAELRRVVGVADDELVRVDSLLDSAEVVATSAESAASTVDALSTLVRIVVIAPIVRLISAFRGLRRFAVRLSGGNDDLALARAPADKRELAA